MSNQGDGGEFFKGFLFGGMIGAVIALLYAPKTGKEMREDLRNASLELRDDAEGKLDLAQQKAEALLEQTKKQLDELRKEAESAVVDLKKSATGKIKDGKKVIENEKTRVKDAIDAGVAAYKEEKQTKGKRA